jgi:hypothetical protein
VPVVRGSPRLSGRRERRRVSEPIPSRPARLGLLGLKRIRTIRNRRDRATKLLEEAIVFEFERRVYDVDEIADAAGMSRQGVYNVAKRRKRDETSG